MPGQPCDITELASSDSGAIVACADCGAVYLNFGALRVRLAGPEFEAVAALFAQAAEAWLALPAGAAHPPPPPPH